MSHAPLRKETDCLNCGTAVAGPFCQNCGQRNTIPREKATDLIVHFFNDITHFEGSFFRTIRQLLTKPGFLPEEYMRGRRASYLNPVRMYLFVSFLLFFIVFSLPDPMAHFLEIKQSSPSKGARVAEDPLDAQADTLASGVYLQKGEITVDDSAWFNRIANDYETVEAYEKEQEQLPSAKRDNWFLQGLAKRLIATANYIRDHEKTWQKDFKSQVFHSIPSMLFYSIPVFAVFLSLLYIRRRREYYFVAHAIFAIHLYCAIYLMMAVLYPLTFVEAPSLQSVVVFLIVVAPMLYLYAAMKRFYKQGYGRTLFKFLILSLSTMVLFVILFLYSLTNAMLSLGAGGHSAGLH